MSVVYWVVFGLIAGSIANFIFPSSQGGIVGSIIVGIMGAVVGGYIGQRFWGTGVTGFDVSSFIVAILGSLLVLFIMRMI